MRKSLWIQEFHTPTAITALRAVLCALISNESFNAHHLTIFSFSVLYLLHLQVTTLCGCFYLLFSPQSIIEVTINAKRYVRLSYKCVGTNTRRV